MAKKTKQKKEESRSGLEFEDIPFVGGLLKGIGKLVDLAGKVEEAGGEIKRKGEIKGLSGKEGRRGVYGFSVRTGIGDRPKIQTFGNIRSTNKKKTGEEEIKVAENREPLVDLFDEKDHILIIVELAGVLEESIKLDVKGDILTLEAGEEQRKYFKEILLPAKVDFASRKMSFKNGILELKMQKTEL
ncbi:Hsp20/alpha crystallin family protein [Patescibacteria group bacterium]